MHWVSGKHDKLNQETTELQEDDEPRMPLYPEVKPEAHSGVKYHHAWDYHHIQLAQSEIVQQLHPNASNWSQIHGAKVLHVTEGLVEAPAAAKTATVKVPHWDRMKPTQRPSTQLLRRPKPASKGQPAVKHTRSMAYNPTKFLDVSHPSQATEAERMKARRSWMHFKPRNAARDAASHPELLSTVSHADDVDMALAVSSSRGAHPLLHLLQDQDVTLMTPRSRLVTRRDFVTDGISLMAVSRAMKKNPMYKLVNNTYVEMSSAADQELTAAGSTEPLSDGEKAFTGYVSDGNFKGRGTDDIPAICNCLYGSPARDDTDPKCQKAGEDLCVSCDEGFNLEDGKCIGNACHCTNGSPRDPKACTEHEGHECASCDPGFHLEKPDKKTCGANVCDCKHGTAATNVDCLVHESNTCKKCNEGEFDDAGFPLNWVLTKEQNCEIRPCEDCYEECNDMMEQDAWHIRVKFETSGIRLKIPDAIYDAMGHILPVKAVHMYEAEYSGLLPATQGRADAAAKLTSMVNKTKTTIKNVNEKASALALRAAAEAEDPTGYNASVTFQNASAAANATEDEGLGFMGILDTLGVPKNATEAFLKSIGDALGGLDVLKTLKSVEAEVNETDIKISGGLIFETKFYAFEMYAKDYTGPTQEQKESICQPKRKVLGARLKAALEIEGTQGSVFSTAIGMLDFKARFYRKDDWHFYGDYTGEHGGIRIGKGKDTSLRLNLTTAQLNFERIPDQMSIDTEGQRSYVEGGIAGRIGGSADVKLPFLPVVSVNELDFQFTKTGQEPSAWAMKFDADVPVAGGRIGANVLAMSNASWGGSLIEMKMETRGETNIKLGALPVIRTMNGADYLPEILPGGTISAVLSTVPLETDEDAAKIGWKPLWAGASMYEIEQPHLEVISDVKSWKRYFNLGLIKIEKATAFLSKDVVGHVTGGQDLSSTLDGAITIRLLYGLLVPVHFSFKILVNGGPQVTLPGGVPEEEATMSFKSTGMLMELSAGDTTICPARRRRTTSTRRRGTDTMDSTAETAAVVDADCTRNGKFVMKFVGQAEAKMHGTGTLGGIVSGEVQRWADGYRYTTVQLYVKGEAFNTKVETLFTVLRERQAEADGGNVTNTYGAAVRFPDGVFLKNLPLFQNLPGIKVVPGLTEGSYFTYSNRKGATSMLLEAVKTSVAEYGALINEDYGKSAASMETALLEGPAQKVGLSLPPTTMHLNGEFEGVLKPLNSMVKPGTNLTLSGLFDPRKGNAELAFSMSGGIEAGLENVAEMKLSTIYTRFESTLQASCDCNATESCVQKWSANRTECWATDIKVGGTGSLEVMTADPPVSAAVKADGRLIEDTENGAYVMTLKAHADLHIWNSTATAFVDLKPDAEDPTRTLLQMAISVNNFKSKNMPLLAGMGSPINLDRGIIFMANHEVTIDQNTYKPGLTVAGYRTYDGEKPSFLASLSDRFGTDLQKGYLSAWLPVRNSDTCGPEGCEGCYIDTGDGAGLQCRTLADYPDAKQSECEGRNGSGKRGHWCATYGGKSDFALSVGVAGSLSLYMGSAEFALKDPRFTSYRTQGKTYTSLVSSGFAKIGKRFRAEFKELTIRTTSTDKSVFLSGPSQISVTNHDGSNTTTLSAAFEFFMGHVANGTEAPQAQPAAPPVLDGAQVVDDLSSLVDAGKESSVDPMSVHGDQNAQSLLQISTEGPTFDGGKSSLEFYLIMGPFQKSLTGTGLDDVDAVVTSGVTMTLSSLDEAPVSAEAAQSVGERTIPKGLSVYADVAVKEGTALHKVMSVKPFTAFPRSARMSMSVSLSGDDKHFELASLRTPDSSGECWDLIGAKGANKAHLNGTSSFGTLAICKLQTSFVIQTTDGETAIDLGISGQARLENTFLGDIVDLPQVQGTIGLNEDGDVHAFFGSVSKYTLFGGTKNAIDMGVSTFGIKLIPDDGMTWGISMEASPSSVMKLMRIVFSNGGSGVAKLLTKVTDLMAKLTSGATIKFSLATGVMDDKVGDDVLKIESAGFSVALTIAMPDAMLSLGIPPIGFIKTANGVVDIAGVRASAFFICPFEFLWIRGGTWGYDLAHAPTIGIRADQGPTIMNTLRMDRLELSVTPALQGMDISFGGQSSVNVHSCDSKANGFGCVIKGKMRNALKTRIENAIAVGDQEKADMLTKRREDATIGAPWLKDQWIKGSITGTITSTGTVSLHMAVGLWEDAFGINGFDAGNLWMRLSVNVPACSAAVTAALATAGAAIPAVIAACFGGIGLGGEASFDLGERNGNQTIAGKAQGYISIAEPEKVMLGISATSMGLSTGSKLILRLAEDKGSGKNIEKIQKMNDFLDKMGSVDKAYVSFAAFNGKIGQCPGEYPHCIKFKMGAEIFGNTTIAGLNLHAHLLGQLSIPPKTLIGYGFDATATAAMVQKVQQRLVSVLPWTAAIQRAFENMFKFAGVAWPLPMLRLTRFRLHDVDIFKWIMGLEKMRVELDAVVLGKEKAIDMMFTFKEFQDFAKTLAYKAGVAVRALMTWAVPNLITAKLNMKPLMIALGLQMGVELDQTHTHMTLYLKNRRVDFIHKVVRGVAKAMNIFKAALGDSKKQIDDFGGEMDTDDIPGLEDAQKDIEELKSHNVSLSDIPVSEEIKADALFQEMQDGTAHRRYATQFDIPEMTEFIARHATGHSTPSENDHGEADAISLIQLVPTHFKEACRVAARIKKQHGQKRFKELTGRDDLRCSLTSDQEAALAQGKHVSPLNDKEYNAMASLIEARTHAGAESKVRKAMEAKFAEVGTRIDKDFTNALEIKERQFEVRNEAGYEQAVKEIGKNEKTGETLVKDLDQHMEDEVKHLNEVANATIAKDGHNTTGLRLFSECVQRAVADTDHGSMPGKAPVHCHELRKQSKALQHIDSLASLLQSLEGRHSDVHAHMAKLIEEKANEGAGAQAGRNFKFSWAVAENQGAAVEKRNPVPDSCHITDNEQCSNSKPCQRPRCDGQCLDEHECHQGDFFSPAEHPDNKIRIPSLLDFSFFDWLRGKVQARDCSFRCWFQRRVKRIKWRIANLAQLLKHLIWKAIQAVKEKALQMLKTLVQKAKDAIANIFKPMLSLITPMMKNIPVFRYLRIGHIYVKCLIDPKNCEPYLQERPSFEMAFSTFTIGPARIPALKELVKWTLKVVRRAVRRMVESWFNMREITIKLPKLKCGFELFKPKSPLVRSIIFKTKSWFGKVESTPEEEMEGADKTYGSICFPWFEFKEIHFLLPTSLKSKKEQKCDDFSGVYDWTDKNGKARGNVTVTQDGCSGRSDEGHGFTFTAYGDVARSYIGLETIRGTKSMEGQHEVITWDTGSKYGVRKCHDVAGRYQRSETELGCAPWNVISISKTEAGKISQSPHNESASPLNHTSKYYIGAIDVNKDEFCLDDSFCDPADKARVAKLGLEWESTIRKGGYRGNLRRDVINATNFAVWRTCFPPAKYDVYHDKGGRYQPWGKRQIETFTSGKSVIFQKNCKIGTAPGSIDYDLSLDGSLSHGKHRVGSLTHKSYKADYSRLMRSSGGNYPVLTQWPLPGTAMIMTLGKQTFYSKCYDFTGAYIVRGWTKQGSIRNDTLELKQTGCKGHSSDGWDYVTHGDKLIPLATAEAHVHRYPDEEPFTNKQQRRRWPSISRLPFSERIQRLDEKYPNHLPNYELGQVDVGSSIFIDSCDNKKTFTSGGFQCGALTREKQMSQLNRMLRRRRIPKDWAPAKIITMSAVGKHDAMPLANWDKIKTVTYYPIRALAQTYTMLSPPELKEYYAERAAKERQAKVDAAIAAREAKKNELYSKISPEQRAAAMERDQKDDESAAKVKAKEAAVARAIADKKFREATAKSEVIRAKSKQELVFKLEQTVTFERHAKLNDVHIVKERSAKEESKELNAKLEMFRTDAISFEGLGSRRELLAEMDQVMQDIKVYQHHNLKYGYSTKLEFPFLAGHYAQNPSARLELDTEGNLAIKELSSAGYWSDQAPAHELWNAGVRAGRDAKLELRKDGWLKLYGWGQNKTTLEPSRVVKWQVHVPGTNRVVLRSNGLLEFQNATRRCQKVHIGANGDTKGGTLPNWMRKAHLISKRSKHIYVNPAGGPATCTLAGTSLSRWDHKQAFKQGMSTKVRSPPDMSPEGLTKMSPSEALGALFFVSPDEGIASMVAASDANRTAILRVMNSIHALRNNPFLKRLWESTTEMLNVKSGGESVYSRSQLRQGQIIKYVLSGTHSHNNYYDRPWLELTVSHQAATPALLQDMDSFASAAVDDFHLPPVEPRDTRIQEVPPVMGSGGERGGVPWAAMGRRLLATPGGAPKTVLPGRRRWADSKLGSPKETAKLVVGTKSASVVFWGTQLMIRGGYISALDLNEPVGKLTLAEATVACRASAHCLAVQCDQTTGPKIGGSPSKCKLGLFPDVRQLFRSFKYEKHSGALLIKLPYESPYAVKAKQKGTKPLEVDFLSLPKELPNGMYSHQFNTVAWDQVTAELLCEHVEKCRGFSCTADSGTDCQLHQGGESTASDSHDYYERPPYSGNFLKHKRQACGKELPMDSSLQTKAQTDGYEANTANQGYVEDVCTELGSCVAVRCDAGTENNCLMIQGAVDTASSPAYDCNVKPKYRNLFGYGQHHGKGCAGPLFSNHKVPNSTSYTHKDAETECQKWAPCSAVSCSGLDACTLHRGRTLVAASDGEYVCLTKPLYDARSRPTRRRADKFYTKKPGHACGAHLTRERIRSHRGYSFRDPMHVRRRYAQPGGKVSLSTANMAADDQRTVQALCDDTAGCMAVMCVADEDIGCTMRDIRSANVNASFDCNVKPLYKSRRYKKLKQHNCGDVNSRLGDGGKGQQSLESECTYGPSSGRCKGIVCAADTDDDCFMTDSRVPTANASYDCNPKQLYTSSFGFRKHSNSSCGSVMPLDTHKNWGTQRPDRKIRLSGLASQQDLERFCAKDSKCVAVQCPGGDDTACTLRDSRVMRSDATADCNTKPLYLSGRFGRYVKRRGHGCSVALTGKAQYQMDAEMACNADKQCRAVVCPHGTDDNCRLCADSRSVANDWDFNTKPLYKSQRSFMKVRAYSCGNFATSDHSKMNQEEAETKCVETKSCFAVMCTRGDDRGCTMRDSRRGSPDPLFDCNMAPPVWKRHGSELWPSIRSSCGKKIDGTRAMDFGDARKACSESTSCQAVECLPFGVGKAPHNIIVEDDARCTTRADVSRRSVGLLEVQMIRRKHRATSTTASCFTKPPYTPTDPKYFKITNTVCGVQPMANGASMSLRDAHTQCEAIHCAVIVCANGRDNDCVMYNELSPQAGRRGTSNTAGARDCYFPQPWYSITASRSGKGSTWYGADGGHRRRLGVRSSATFNYGTYGSNLGNWSGFQDEAERKCDTDLTCSGITCPAPPQHSSSWYRHQPFSSLDGNERKAIGLNHSPRCTLRKWTTGPTPYSFSDDGNWTFIRPTVVPCPKDHPGCPNGYDQWKVFPSVWCGALADGSASGHKYDGETFPAQEALTKCSAMRLALPAPCHAVMCQVDGCTLRTGNNGYFVKAASSRCLSWGPGPYLRARPVSRRRGQSTLRRRRVSQINRSPGRRPSVSPWKTQMPSNGHVRGAFVMDTPYPPGGFHASVEDRNGGGYATVKTTGIQAGTWLDDIMLQCCQEEVKTIRTMGSTCRLHHDDHNN